MAIAPALLRRVRGESYFNPKSLRVTKAAAGLAALIAIITSSLTGTFLTAETLDAELKKILELNISWGGNNSDMKEFQSSPFRLGGLKPFFFFFFFSPSSFFSPFASIPKALGLCLRRNGVSEWCERDREGRFKSILLVLSVFSDQRPSMDT